MCVCRINMRFGLNQDRKLVHFCSPGWMSPLARLLQQAPCDTTRGEKTANKSVQYSGRGRKTAFKSHMSPGQQNGAQSSSRFLLNFYLQGCLQHRKRGESDWQVRRWKCLAARMWFTQFSQSEGLYALIKPVFGLKSCVILFSHY